MALPWTGHGHDPQHTGLSRFASRPLNRIRWQTPVDLAPQYSGHSLLVHYGTPLITRQNTVIIPVKTGPTDGFRVEAHAAADGALKWTLATDYALPPHNWVPGCGIALTPKNRLYFPGAGGTVYFRDAPDSASGVTGQLAFYGLANYAANPAGFNAAVRINTPITADRYGNIFFGFEVTGATTPALTSGLARIAEDGTGMWISAGAAAADSAIRKVVLNCAPALSNDHRTLYFAVSEGDFAGGYLVAVDSRTLAPVARIRLKDVHAPALDAPLADDGTSSPTIGPDGDVFFGVLEANFESNDGRGWLLHFDASLSQAKPAGAFGWDDTASIVPAALVPSYQGTSAYLVLSKYNHYAGAGGDGHNELAVLDPNAVMTDATTGANVMKEILTVLGPTPDFDFPEYFGAVREWCVNVVAIDSFSRSAVVHSEDGLIYRWNFTDNSLTQALTLTQGIGTAYTPTTIGVDGTVYVVANATLFAVAD